MGDLYAIAQAIQAAVVASFNDANIDLPERQYVTAGEVAFDCDQLVTSVGALTTGKLSADYQGAPHPGEIPIGGITVVLVRKCQPIPDEEGQAPSAEAIESASAALLPDGDLLVRTFLKKPHKTLGGVCSAVKVLSCAAYGPSGGFGGWVLTLRVVL